jgi:hypothetical protein
MKVKMIFLPLRSVRSTSQAMATPNTSDTTTLTTAKPTVLASTFQVKESRKISG